MIRNILEYLEKTAKRLPDKIAFSGAEGTITFAELEETAKRIGTYLTRFGGRSCPIAVMMQKTPVSVAAFLGAVYSGNFYTPIDVTMPKERVLSILHTLQPQVLLIDEKAERRQIIWATRGKSSFWRSFWKRKLMMHFCGKSAAL